MGTKLFFVVCIVSALAAAAAGCGGRRTLVPSDGDALSDGAGEGEAGLDGSADADGAGDAARDGDAGSDLPAGDGDRDIPEIPDAPPETRAGMGPGTGNEYNPAPDNSSGVDLDDDGWLVLDTERIANEYLWVANSGEGTVSKIDVETDVEVGRFFTGLDARNADPSRTSVDLAGDVFVGNRANNYPADTQLESSLTKIAAHASRCVDRDGDTVIETSTGPAPLPRNDGSDPHVPVGQSTDECVVWTKDLSAEPQGCRGLRAVAATAETGDDFEVNGHVWAGCWKDHVAYKLHGNTGAVLAAHVLPACAPYGFVLDDRGRLWVSCRDAWHGDDPRYGSIAWIDTATGDEHVVPPATERHPGATNVPNPYGIAINGDRQVFITTYEGGLYRWDETGGWAASPDTMPSPARGVAVDADGWVWAISTGSAKVYLFDPATLEIVDEWDASDGVHSTSSGNGVAIDFSGDVWAVTENTGGPHGWATHFATDRTGARPAAAGRAMVPTGLKPYTYSDMIGYSLRHFTTREGWYNHVFEACPGHSVKWKEIAWEADVPAGTSIVIRARTADHLVDLDAASWTTLAQVPDDVSPVLIPETLPEGHYIELEVRLFTTTDGASPAVGAITFDWECTSPII